MEPGPSTLPEEVPPAPAEPVIPPIDDREHPPSPRSTTMAAHLEGTAADAFAAKHLVDLGIPVLDFKRYSWRIPNYRKLAKRMTSDTFNVGGHEW